jgi:Uncharacterized conserved protein
MSLEPFIDSKPFTFGVELEMQIVNTHDYDLTKAGSDLMRLIKDEKIPGNITPEITESMIELSTGICTTHEQAVTDLRKIRDTLVSAADHLNVGLCGGGTHASSNGASGRSSIRRAFSIFRVVRLPCQAIYGVRPARSHRLSGSEQRAVSAALHVALHSAFHRVVRLVAVRTRCRYRFSFGTTEFRVRVPAVGPRAVRADVGQLRRIFLEDGPHRRGQQHEGFLLGHPAEAGFGTIEVR